MIMKVTLINQNGRFPINLPFNKDFVIGRDTKGLTISHPEISRRHLVLNIKNGKIEVEDLSTNGTFVNGKKIPAHQRIEVKPGAKIGLTADESVFIVAEHDNSNKKEQVPDNTLQKLLAYKSTVTIGRDASCDIVIDDQSVSRKHATVKKVKGEFIVYDHSLNGTFINGRRIGNKCEFGEGDVLIIGLNRFTLAGISQNLQEQPVIQVSGVTHTFPGGNIGLMRTSFTVTDKSMVALMGPSGCGKSTLLNVLNGFISPGTGAVKIFGLNLSENFDVIKQYIGFVPQNDIVHEHLTVMQALHYTAKLRLGNRVADDEVQERINDVLAALKINDENITRSLIGNLSGGQKKRVSIAVELLTKPKILFLDEPTGPLDPETIEEFLKTLKKLCSEGTTIVMVTHKPDDLTAMDEVIFMAGGGKFIFKGSEDDIYDWFEEKNINRIYRKADDPVESRRLYTKWNNRHKSGDTIERKPVRQADGASVNALEQTYWLVMRYLHLKWNNRKNLVIAFLQPVFIAMLILLVFPELLESHEGLKTGNLGVLFIAALSVIWFGISNSAKEIVSELAIYRRERAFNLLPGAYQLSKTIVLTLLTAGQILVFLAILFTGFSELNHFLLTFLFFVLLGLASVSFGLMLSAFGKSTEAVMTVLPVALIPQIVLAGIIQPVENTLTQILSYFTFGRWGTEGFARIQDRGLSSEPYPFLSALKQNLYPEGVSDFTASLSANGFFLLFLFVVISMITLVKITQKQEL